MKLRFITEGVGCTWISASQSWDQGHLFPRRDRVELAVCSVHTMGAGTGYYDKRWVSFAELAATGRVGM